MEWLGQRVFSCIKLLRNVFRVPTAVLGAGETSKNWIGQRSLPRWSRHSSWGGRECKKLIPIDVSRDPGRFYSHQRCLYWLPLRCSLRGGVCGRRLAALAFALSKICRGWGWDGLFRDVDLCVWGQGGGYGNSMVSWRE